MSEVFDGELRVIRRNRWIVGLSLSPLGAALAAVFAGLTTHPGFLVIVPHLLILSLVIWAVAWAKNPWASAEPARVRANADGIRVGERFVPRSTIRAGYVVPAMDKSPTRVLLQRSMALPVQIAVKDANEGRRLLHALGLDASQSVATFRALSRVWERPWLTLLAGLALVPLNAAFAGFARQSPTLGMLTLPVGLLGFLGLLSVFLIPTRLDVGVDGIVLRWLWQRRFISYAEIDLVTPYSVSFGRSRICGLRLILKEGTIDLPINQSSLDNTKLSIIDERIREAMESFRQGGAETDAALVRRGDRGIAEWITALRSIGAGANAGPRTAPVAPERLWRIVEDPQAEAPARAAAAIALGAEPDDASRARLRAVAEATAAPKLRIAIEAAAAETEGDLEAALAEVEAEQEEHRKKA